MSEKKQIPEPEELGSPLYMLSFGDMMTNLLCFFILLCAFASERKVGFISDGLGAFRNALLAHGMPGVLSSDSLPLDLGAKRVLFRPSRSILPRMLVDEEGHIKDGNRDALRNVVKEALEKESTTELPLSFVFPPGSAALTPAHKAAIRELAPRLAGGGFRIRLEGFAWREGLPRREEWGLAFDRARAVMQEMVAAGKIDPLRFDVMGYGPPEKGSRGRDTQLTWGRRTVVVSLVQST